MVEPSAFYICPFCFTVCEQDQRCHGHPMVRCVPGNWGMPSRMPVADGSGKMYSRAPRWYLEAVGWIQAGGRYTPLHTS